MTSRRTYYHLGGCEHIPVDKILKMIEQVMLTTPSAFNVQSTRIVLLLGQEHMRLWEIVKQTLRPLVAPEAFGRTESKIDGSFAAGCATILFFEDEAAIKVQKRTMPTYADKFDIYSAQTSAMHQFAVWVMLREMGFGASLQHYNPLIDEAVTQQWGLNPDWRLNAQMPFGRPLQEPAARVQIKPIAERLLVFGK